MLEKPGGLISRRPPVLSLFQSLAGFEKALLFFVFASLISCATRPALSPVDLMAQPGGLDWQPLYGEDGLPLDGLALLAAKTLPNSGQSPNSGPKLELWAIRADLASPNLRIVVGPKSFQAAGQNEGSNTSLTSQTSISAGTVPSIKVSSFVREYGCVAAINANPFEPSSGREGEARTVIGLAVSEGAILSPPNPRYDALVFFDAKPGEGGLRAAVVSQAAAGQNAGVSESVVAGKAAAANKTAVTAGDRLYAAGVFAGGRPLLYAAGGFYRILEAGVPTARALSEQGRARHPRSAAGLSADGRILYLLVIDGRRPGSTGATEEETALILKKLGAADGLCFDGGGSSALALRASALKAAASGADATAARTKAALSGVTVLNKPVHGGIPGTERAVAICLGIAAAKPSKD